MGVEEIVLGVVSAALKLVDTLEEKSRQKVYDQIHQQLPATRSGEVQALLDEAAAIKAERDQLAAEIAARKKAHAAEAAAHDETKAKLAELTSKIDLAKPVP